MRNSSRWFRNLEEDGFVEEEDGDVAPVFPKIMKMQRKKNQAIMMNREMNRLFRKNSRLDVDIMFFFLDDVEKQEMTSSPGLLVLRLLIQ